ncbi:MAG: hypothetical protein WAM28_04575 [Chlamydiales bacterium]
MSAEFRPDYALTFEYVAKATAHRFKYNKEHLLEAAQNKGAYEAMKFLIDEADCYRLGGHIGNLHTIAMRYFNSQFPESHHDEMNLQNMKYEELNLEDLLPQIEKLKKFALEQFMEKGMKANDFERCLKGREYYPSEKKED